MTNTFIFRNKSCALEKMQALGRKKQGYQNKTEQEYDNLLFERMHAGEISWYKFEGMKFRLADNTFYTPDFSVMLSNGEMEIHETKGYMTDDANVKIKVAADMYPFRFFIVRKRAKKNGGGFSIDEV